MWARKRGKLWEGLWRVFKVFPARGIEAQTNTKALRYNIFTMPKVILISEVWLKVKQVV